MSRNSGEGTLPMSGAVFSYRASEVMVDYDQKIAKNLGDFRTKQICAFGGWEIDSDGTFKMIEGSDGMPHGLMAEFIENSNTAAEAAGDVYRMDAKASTVEAITGGAALGLSGLDMIRTRAGSLNDQLEDAKAMQTDLNDGKSGAKFTLGEDKSEEVEMDDMSGPASKAVSDKADSWAESKSQLGGYTKKYGGATDEQTELNDKAMRHAKANPQKKTAIQKNLDEHIESLHRQIQNLDTKFNSDQQFINQLSTTVKAGVTSVYQNQKANEQVESQKQQALASEIEKILSTEMSAINDSKQAMDQRIQAAQQDAASFAQIQQLHG